MLLILLAVTSVMVSRLLKVCSAYVSVLSKEKHIWAIFFYKSVLGLPYSSNALKLKTVNWLCVKDLFYAGKVTFKSSLQVFHSQNILCCNDCTCIAWKQAYCIRWATAKKRKAVHGLRFFPKHYHNICFRCFHRPVTSLWEYKYFSKKIEIITVCKVTINLSKYAVVKK